MTDPVYYSARVFQIETAVTDPVYTIGFPYLQPQDIYVFTGVEIVVPENEEPPPVPTIEWTLVPFGPGIAGRWEFDNEGLNVKLNLSIPAGRYITIRRFSRRDSRLADYFNGSTLTEFDLNIVTKQLLFLIQEMLDSLGIIALGTGSIGGGGGGGGPGGGGGNPGGGSININDIIAALNATQLFRDLRALIPLLDVNAELIISTLLNDHSNWAIGRQAGAGVRTLTRTVQNNTESIAEIIAQLDANFSPEGFNGLLNAAQAIIGIRGRADGQEARIEGIASFIAGSGVTFGPNGELILPPNPGGINATLAAVQTTQVAHATQLVAEAQFRTALGSYFNVGNPDDPNYGTTLAAAIQDRWRTYTDSQSAVAQRVTNMEVNNKPVFYGTVFPNQNGSTGSLYPDPQFTAPFQTTGFPSGTLWFRELGGARRPFMWFRGTSPLPGIVPPDWVPNVDYFVKDFGPPATHGVWWPNTDNFTFSVLAASINNVATTRITEEDAQALVESTIAVTFGGAANGYAAVNERMQSLFRAPTESNPGLVYSTWNVRVNAQLNNPPRPVIAGVGLGLQGDPATGNFISDFMVMANRFSVILPPSGGEDPLTGSLDPTKLVVPFIVDANTSSVIVNGQLIARSLAAADAGVGRLTVGQIDPLTGLIQNPLGNRLVLPSQTNNWNAAVGDTTPFPGQRYLVWAGQGEMNHSNAIFYIDTAGNARFTGVVVADNLVGTVNDAIAINESFTEVVAGGGNGGPSGIITTWLDDRIQTLPPTIRPRRVVATVGISMYGNGVSVGTAALAMSVDGGPWTVIAQSPVNQAFGTTITLTGGLTSPTSGQVRLRVGIGPGPQSTGQPRTNYFAGVMQGIR